MKKYLFILLLIIPYVGLTQESYKIELTDLSYEIRDFLQHPTTSNVRIDLTYEDYSIQTLYFKQIRFKGDNELNWSSSPIVTNKRPKYLRTWGFVNFSSGNDAKYDSYGAFEFCSTTSYVIGTISGRMSDIRYQIKVTPNVKISSVDSKGNENNFLPSEDNIILQANTGFSTSIYNWQYSSDGVAWNDFPPAINSLGQSSVNITLRDIYGLNYNNFIGRNTYFRIKACEGDYSNILTLSNIVSAPHLNSIVAIPNTCFGEENGSFRIFFDRSLNPNESLNLILTETSTGEVYNIVNVESLESDNSISTPSNLPPGNYKVEIINLYNGSPGYSEAQNHSSVASFKGPSALDFNVFKRDIYCFNGKDGTITVNASGGSGNYKLMYKSQKDASYTEAKFSSNAQHVIVGLDAGTYQVRVEDQNGCSKKDGSGNEVINEITISQPKEALKVDYKIITQPTAFGASDGKAELIVVGGTTNDGKYHIQWTDIDGNVLTNFTNSGSPFKTTLNNVREGKYIVRITDDNYKFANEQNTGSCFVIDTITIIQPEPLKVVIQESNYISCNGDADGKLYAIASGGVIIPNQKYKYEWFKEVNGEFSVLNQIDSNLVDVGVGFYKVRITDQNNVTKESNSFVLSQPEALILAVSATELTCSQGNNGTASVAITGGTLPYHVEWSNGETGLTIKDISDGDYLVFVTDAHGCQAQAKVTVASPGSIIVSTDFIQNPSCFGSNDGAISHKIEGGVPPYRYQWSNGMNTQNLSNLPAGNYTLSISDSNNCGKTVSYFLKDPENGKVNLGPDRTLCVGQVHEADATIPNGSIYKWKSDKGFTATTAKVILNESGRYDVEILTDKGCVVRDTIEIRRSIAIVEAEFVVTTQAFKNETIHLVNISNPKPEGFEWLVPNNSIIKVLSKTDENLQLVFSEPGVYNIGLKAMQGDCSKIFTKQITVLEATSFKDPGKTNVPFVKSFKVTPNPSNGNFWVKIELQETSKIKLRLLNAITGQVVDIKEENGNSNYDLSYHLTIPNGIYVLVLETPKANLVHKVLIN